MDIGDSFQNTTDGIFDFLPNLLGFFVILLVGFIVAKVVSGVIELLQKLNVDQKLQESSSGSTSTPPSRAPRRAAGSPKSSSG